MCFRVCETILLKNAYLTLSPNPASNLIAQEILGEPPLPYMKTFDGDLNTPRLKDDDLLNKFFFNYFKLIWI